MGPQKRLAFSVLLVLLAAGPVGACLWDYDTLPMERTRFPNALELIAGKFLRHSREFYQWRIADRRARLGQLLADAEHSSPPTSDELGYFDDLAVAYNKVGQHDKAIETILRKDALSPGRYETYANLGAFYIYTGELEKARDAIARAIEINPQAHFGREVYQKHLVEYVLSQRVDGQVKLPLNAVETPHMFQLHGFAKHLQAAAESNSLKWEEEHGKAVHGVLGMMRFADHQHPVLLEALGDLLSAQGRESDAKRLAARAYLAAAAAVADPQAKAAYRKMAESVLNMQTGAENSLAALEPQFIQERADGEEWFAAQRQQEMQWIAAGLDADAEFAKIHYAEPWKIGSWRQPWLYAAFGLVLLGMGVSAALRLRTGRIAGA